MKRIITPLALVSLLAVPGISPVAAEREAGSDMARIHSVDYRGKPPFRRMVTDLPAAEVARLEAVATPDGAETVTITTRRGLAHGKPPYRRVTRTLPVTEVARLELFAQEEPRGTDFSGRPPFKRH